MLGKTKKHSIRDIDLTPLRMRESRNLFNKSNATMPTQNHYGNTNNVQKSKTTLDYSLDEIRSVNTYNNMLST